MKVAIDIRRISDFGVGTYIRNIVRTLARIDLKDEFFLVGQPEQINEIGNLPPNFQPIAFPGPEISFRNYFEFRRIVKRLGCDLVHIPHTFWVPTPAHCPYVMTVHDLLDYMYRVKMDSSFRRTVHFYMTRQALSRADRLFAVSNFTKKDIVRIFNVPEERIEVVYNAIDERFRRGGEEDYRRALSGKPSVPALCRTHQPSQERGPHHRGLRRTQG
jgi:glycosyltransferase involved in cell wall biosynthesis